MWRERKIERVKTEKEREGVCRKEREREEQIERTRVLLQRNGSNE